MWGTVMQHFLERELYRHTYEYIQERSHTHVGTVMQVFLTRAVYVDTP